MLNCFSKDYSDFLIQSSKIFNAGFYLVDSFFKLGPGFSIGFKFVMCIGVRERSSRFSVRLTPAAPSNRKSRSLKATSPQAQSGGELDADFPILGEGARIYTRLKRANNFTRDLA